MRPQEIEVVATQAVERALSSHQVEDSRTEFKTDWPDDLERAARQLAGLLNGARGDPVMWIVGVDEKGRVVRGASEARTETWLQQLGACFDGFPPRTTDVVFRYGEATLVALWFEATSLPYVVKLREGPEKVTREVPWRHGTTLRSARRDELLLVLTPSVRTPEIELLGGTLVARETSEPAPSGQPGALVRLTVDLYVVPHQDGNLVIPDHRCSGQVRAFGPSINFSRVSFEPLYKTSSTIKRSDNQVFISAPGMVRLEAAVVSERQAFSLADEFATADVRVTPIGAAGAFTISVELGLDADYSPHTWIHEKGPATNRS